MLHRLRYGDHREIELELGDNLLADWSGPHGEPIDDPVAAVAAALADPLEFPALAQATAPDDRVAIAIGDNVPQIDAIVAGVVHELKQGYAEAKDITLVLPSGMRPPVELLSESDREAVRIHVHQADQRDQLAYLAAARDGEPIYFSKVLADADIVIPIGAFRADQTLAYYGVHSGLFPTFADVDTQRRFREYRNNADRHQRQLRQAEAEEAAWVLGVLFTVQVIPGRDGSVLGILAGHSGAVEREGVERVQAAWGFQTGRRAGLVIAAIEGGAEEQTWANFARALHAAQGVAEEDAAIVLCTQLADAPGPALQQLRSGAAELPELDASSEPDGLSAALLAELRERNHVLLLSELDQETVEDLGMGHVQDEQAVQRLAGQFDSCILLGAAQRTAPVAAS